jgi:arsenate reductase
VSEFAGREFDDVITVCDAANEQCPIFPGRARRHHRDFKDPASVAGSEEQQLAAFRQTRDELRHWLTDILAGGP